MSQTQIVNGKLCYNCTDVDRARQDPNPARTQKAKELGVDPSRITPDGQVGPKSSSDAGSANAVAPAAALGVNQPLTAGTKGREVNLLA